MTKQPLKTEIDELRDEILEELDPTDRAGLMLRAHTLDREEWVNRLRRTCPQHTYKTSDVEFTNRMHLAFMGGYEVLYNLCLALERFRYVMLQRQRDKWVSIVAAEEMEPLVEDLAAETEGTAKPINWIAHMAVIYYGYEQFAEEILGISSAEWVNALPGEKPVVGSAAEVLELYERKLDIGTTEGDSEDVVEVAAGAEELYETLREEWQRVDEPIFMLAMDRRDFGDPR